MSRPQSAPDGALAIVDPGQLNLAGVLGSPTVYPDMAAFLAAIEREAEVPSMVLLSRVDGVSRADEDTAVYARAATR